MKLVTVLLIIALASCTERAENISYEKGKIVAMQYSAPINASGSGYGVSSSGEFVTTHTTVHEDEKWTVVFKCEHGVVFTINRQELWNRLAEGDSVDISYYDIYKKKTKKVVDFDFVNATKINP